MTGRQKDLIMGTKLYRPLFVVLLLGVISCGCQRSDYLAEKAFYNASKVLTNVHNIYEGSDPKDPTVLEPAVDAFQKIAETYPSSPKSPEALFIVSQIRREQGNLSAARQALARVIQNYTGMESWAEDARYRIAQLHEEEGNWLDAEKAYWEVIEYHPLKPKGLYAPISILNQYKSRKDAAGEQKAYEKIIQHFQKLIKEIGPIEISTGIKYFLGIVHASSGSWQEACTLWLAAADEMKESSYAPLCILAAAEVSWKNGENEAAAGIYDKFYSVYGNHSLAARVSVRRAQLYHQMNRFGDEREWLTKCIDQYFSENRDAQADIKLMIGRSYQDEGLWADAEKVYQEIESDYPASGAALQVPLMAALYHEGLGQAEEAKKLLDAAIERYEQLGEEQPDSLVSQQARRMMNEAYALKGDWEQVLANVDEDMEMETVVTRKGSWLFLKALIAENRLSDTVQAQSLYQSFLKDYPSHPLAKLAKNHLEALAS